MNPAQPQSRRQVLARMFGSAVAAGVLLPGCRSMNWFMTGNDLGPAPPTDATKEQLVSHLNSNIARLYAWRSTDVQLQARGGLPIKLSASVAVESPQNFRLRVNSVAGDEADFGSNAELLWFWIRRNDPNRVFIARHDQLAGLQQRVQIPFQPGWLMEVLGVIPLDAAKFTLSPADPQSGTVSLVSETLGANGQPVRRVILVDNKHGVILGHSLYDATGNLIAKAMLKEHRMHQEHQVVMPHRIELDWPNAQMAMTMFLGKQVEINPTSMPQAMWQPPPRLPVFNIAQGLAGPPPMQSAEEPPGRAVLK